MPRELTPGFLIRAELQGPVVMTITYLSMQDDEALMWKDVRTTNGTRVIHHSIMSEFREYIQRNALERRPIGVYSDFMNHQLRCFCVPFPPLVTIRDFLD
ncbi:hypothetical protein LINGRAHAP2_LOCUS22356 [Linum grandiflorum]